MCVVSMVGQHYTEKFHREWPQFFPGALTPTPHLDFGRLAVSRQEFDELKRQVEEMVSLLRRAKMYDESHSEPDCEIEEKMAALRTIARLVGVDLDATLKVTQETHHG